MVGFGKRASLLAVVVAGLVAGHGDAFAWKPFTHVYTGKQAYQDAVADGFVTINGRNYAVDPALLDALREQGSHFNAGVIGPDGFPDLTFGQSVIHPTNTGEWLRHILARGRAVQANPAISAAAKKQSLAFSYGFLTHAAGDMWGHTFVNDFARGVFPGISELVQLDKAEIAIRHLIVEGYVGDATFNFDGNPAAGPAPGRGCPAGNPLCDRSDDSTPGIDFDAPVDFIYDTLIDPAAGAPSSERGPLIGFFRGLRAELVSFRNGSLATDLKNAANKFNDTKEDVEQLKSACDFDDLSDLIDCPAKAIELGITAAIDTFEAAIAAGAALVKEAVRVIFSSYIEAWIADIDRGLRNWGKLGLASTRALFDPQTRRDFQNDDCKFHVEGTDARDDCEADAGMVDTLMFASNDFINQYMLSMLGLPDLVGEVRAALDEIMDQVDDILVALNLPFNPIRVVKDQIEQYAKNLLKDMIESAVGVDLDALNSFLKAPGAWFLVGDTPPAIGAFFGFPGQSLSLFRPDDHERADSLLGLVGDHHIPTGLPFPGFPPNAATRLADNAEFNAAMFRALDNTVVTAKLLLLSGAELNRALGDVLVAAGFVGDPTRIKSYPSAGADSLSANVMFSELSGGQAWLKSIDSDHAWRRDGLPRFCNDVGGDCDAIDGKLPQPRSSDLNGGNGNFPLWESCLLRPVFRTLYRDWEASGFPDHGDVVAADPSDTGPPAIQFLVQNGFQSGGTIFINNLSRLAVSATDDLFLQAKVGLKSRVFRVGSPAPALAPVLNPGLLSITGNADGQWQVDLEAEEPCHTSATNDALEPSRFTQPIILDTTPPVITIDSPLPNTALRSNQMLTLSFRADDGPLGSGVASLTATFDGAPVTSGRVLDLFTLTPGTHTLAVFAADNLGNAGMLVRTFRVFVDAVSLRDNIDRSFVEGKITSATFYNALRVDATAAIDALNRGRTPDAIAALERLNKTLWKKWDGECRVASRCRDIDPATLALLIVRTADALATIQVPALALGEGNAATGLFETLNKGFLAGRIARGYDVVRAALSPAILKTYIRDFAGGRAAVVKFLDVVEDQLDVVCRASLDTCTVERAFGLELTRLGSEIAATLGLSPEVVASLKALPLLRDIGTALVTGAITTTETFHALRRGLTGATDAETGWQTGDPIVAFRNSLGGVRDKLFELYRRKCVAGKTCNHITVALADDLLVRATRLKAQAGVAPALLASLRTVPLLEDFLLGYRNGELPNVELFEKLSNRLIDAVGAEGGWPKPNRTTDLKDQLSCLLTDIGDVIKAGCASGSKCNKIDRFYADHLLVVAAEALALTGVPAAQAATLKSLPVLRLLGDKYLTGVIPDFPSYVSLRDIAIRAVGAEGRNDKKGATAALKEFVAAEKKLIEKGCTRGAPPCRLLEAAAGQALADEANRSLLALGAGIG